MASSTIPAQIAKKYGRAGKQLAVAGVTSNRWISACSAMPAASDASRACATGEASVRAPDVQRIGLGSGCLRFFAGFRHGRRMDLDSRQ